MKIKETKDFFKYSFKAFFEDFFNLIKEIKKPKTWVYFTMAMVGYGIYANNIKIIKFSIPLLLMIYLIRQKVEGSYKRYIFEKQLIKSKEDYILERYYEKYCIRCSVIDTVPLSYEEWIKKEKVKYYKKHNELD